MFSLLFTNNMAHSPVTFRLKPKSTHFEQLSQMISSPVAVRSIENSSILAFCAANVHDLSVEAGNEGMTGFGD